MDELIIYETQDGQKRMWDLKSKLNYKDMRNLISFTYINQKKKDDNGYSYQEVYRYGIPYIAFKPIDDSVKWDNQEDFLLSCLAVKTTKEEDINTCYCPLNGTSYPVTKNNNTKVCESQKQLIDQMIAKGYNTDYKQDNIKELYYKIISDLYGLKTNLEISKLETSNKENQNDKVAHIKMLLKLIHDYSLDQYLPKIYKLCNCNPEKVRRSLLVILFGEISLTDAIENLNAEMPIPFIDDEISFEGIPDYNVFYLPNNAELWIEYIQKQKEKFYEKFTNNPKHKR